MGYTTDFLGHFTITPALNPAELEYLTAFAESRRWDRPGGPYEVPDNPRADEHETGDVERRNRTAPGQPSLYCQWVVCPQGCCLTHDGHEKFYAPTQWLEYLIVHFLGPDALAAGSVPGVFDDFTFDHALAGVVVARRRDTRRMWAIRADPVDGLSAETLCDGESEESVWGPFPFEWEKDRRRRRRSRRPLSVGSVVASPGTGPGN